MLAVSSVDLCMCAVKKSNPTLDCVRQFFVHFDLFSLHKLLLLFFRQQYTVGIVGWVVYNV